MHNIHDGSLLKRLRIRFFGLTSRELAENLAAWERARREAQRQAELDGEEEEAFLAKVLSCNLCYGDGWITDSHRDLDRCTGDGEQRRFLDRMQHHLTGVPEGRMACPRCRPKWIPL